MKLVAEGTLKARFTYQRVGVNGDFVYYAESNDEAYLERILAKLNEAHEGDINVDVCGFETDYNNEEGIFIIVNVERDLYKEVVNTFKALKKSEK